MAEDYISGRVISSRLHVSFCLGFSGGYSTKTGAHRAEATGKDYPLLVDETQPSWDRLKTAFDGTMQPSLEDETAFD